MKIIKHKICGYDVVFEQVEPEVWIGTFKDFPEKEFIASSKLYLTKDMFSFAKYEANKQTIS